MADYDFTYTGAEIQAILDTGKKLKDSGYIFLGVATPSTNPGTPTQKVYYEAKQAGTYTNFGGIVLSEGLSLLKWNGSWTSETVMSGDGGVFDISVYKSSGGTLATFADLAAALDGGNNIPVNARKGGMSVKFVQSSDNKYVQFGFLLSGSFTDSQFTNTANWQNMGSLLTEKAYDRMVYFSGPSYPTFTKSGDALTVALPSNRKMYVFNIKNGKEIEVDLSQQTTTTFSLISTQRLVYKIDTNEFLVEPSTSSHSADDSRNYIVLLARYGTFSDGAIVGALAGYYYNKQVEAIKTDTTTGINNVESLIAENKEFDLNNYFVGNGNSFALQKIRGLVRGKQYKVLLSKNSFDLSEVTSTGVNVFLIQSVDGNGQKTSVIGQQIADFNTMPSIFTFVVPADSEYIEIGGRSNVGVKVRFSIFDGNEVLIPYFTSASVPTFEIYNTSILKVVLPAAILNLYSPNGGPNNGIVASVDLQNTAASERTYNLESMRKLVLDHSTNTISLVSITNRGDYTVLLSASGSPTVRGGISGILSCYYTAWLAERIKSLENPPVSPNYEAELNVASVKAFSNFEFAFFSDVHGGWTNVQRIVKYAQDKSLDCIINGGDTVLARIESGLTDYNTIISGSSVPILAVAGNHDCWTGSNWNWAAGTDIYNLITAKVKQNVPTIIQPTDAATNGLNYYYKDFGHIRVICLLAMQQGANNLYFDIAQQNWLANVLDDARTTLHYYKATATGIEDYTLQSGEEPIKIYSHLADMNKDNTIVTDGIYAVRMSVIIVTHAPYAASERLEVSKKTNSYAQGFMRTRNMLYDSLKVNDAAVGIVADYISNGGGFICWLAGHMHVDHLFTNISNAGQLMIDITSAKYNLHNIDSASITSEDNPNYDAFDHIGIDLSMGQIKVLRVGLAQDSSMRTRRSWCYDYVNKELMSEN